MQNIMNNTVANIWASMSEEERQDKILSVMDNVDAAIKFAAYDWNELPDGITNLIDSNAPLNELNKYKKLKNTMKQSELKSLIKECYKEVLAENEEMDLPSDTGKNINMGFDNNVGLDVDKRMSGNMNKVMSQIEMLKNKLAPFIADFKSKKLSKEEYMAATKGLVADLKKAQMALELMMAKL